MANEVRVLIRADDKASKPIKDVAAEAQKAVRPLEDIGKIAAGFVVGQGLLKLPGLFSSTVSAASDLAEAGSKVNVVFGPDAVEVTQFAKLADNIGLSDQAALSATGTFGNLFVSMGMPTDQAADMSVEIVKLAADLASFNNIEIADALQKLQAGLVGETEPLRALGVNLSADAVAAKALEMGLAATKAELTAADKATASYKLILQQTTTAQGDFDRTSEGLANKQRMLKADIADLQAEIGQKLVPAMDLGVDVMGRMVEVAGKIEPSTAGIAAVGTAAAIAAPKLLSMAKAAQVATESGAGLSALKTAPGILTAVTVGLVALDLALDKFTGRGLVDRVMGEDGAAASKALAEWDAKIGGLGPNADKAAVAAAYLAQTNQRLIEGMAAASQETGDYGDLLSDLSGHFARLGGGAAPKVVSNFDELAAATKLAAQEMRAGNVPLGEMMAAYQQLNPELREAFDAGSNVLAIWKESTGGLTGLANVLPEVVTAYGLLTPAQDASATATGHWSDAIEDAEKKAKALDEAIATLHGRFSNLDPVYQALNAKAAVYNEEMADLKALGDAATETDKARITELEALLASIEAQTTAMDANKTAIEGTQQILEKLMGPEGYETFQRKLGESKLSLEEQTDVTGKVADAYSDLALKDIPTAMQKFDELKGSLAPEVWQPIAQGLGPDLMEAIRTGVADPAKQAELYQEVWDMMTHGLSAAEKAALGASEIGRQIVNGIATGIRENSYLIVAASAEAAKIPMTEFAAQLEIKSPSKVMAEEIGIPIAQGVALGITKGFNDYVIPTIAEMAAGAKKLAAITVAGPSQAYGLISNVPGKLGGGDAEFRMHLSNLGIKDVPTTKEGLQALADKLTADYYEAQHWNMAAGQIYLPLLGEINDRLGGNDVALSPYEQDLLYAGGAIPYSAKSGNGNIRQLIINTLDARSFREWLKDGGGEEIAAYFDGRKVFA